MLDIREKRHITVVGRGGGGSADTVDWDNITNKPTLYNEWFGTQAEYDLINPKDPDTVYHIEGGQPVQSDWNEADNTSLAYIANKPSTETLTFTLQGGTTVTLDVYVAPQLP
jgi:hypothetical protein